MRLLTIAIVVPVLLAGCVALPPGQAPAVPPVRAERIPKPPPTTLTLIWRPGHWDWDGRDYRWAEGEWVPRAGHGPLWQDGFWRRSGAGFVWTPAHWI